jgi:CheY-like chemotaxis protein
MGEMDGFEVCTRILATQNAWFDSMKKEGNLRKFKARKFCPVVAVTAHCDDSVQRRASKVGMKCVINKPVSMESLVGVIKQYTNIIF